MRYKFLFAAWLIGGSLFAQDSLKHRPIAADTTGVEQKPTVVPQPTSPARQANEYREEDRSLIQPDQLPAILKETLKDPRYSGWENSSLYQDRITGDYMIEIKNGSESSRTYRFDKAGKLIEDPNRPKPKD